MLLFRCSLRTVFCYGKPTLIMFEFTVYLADVDQTCDIGSPPKAVPGEPWMKTVLREIRSRCPWERAGQEGTMCFYKSLS